MRRSTPRRSTSRPICSEVEHLSRRPARAAGHRPVHRRSAAQGQDHRAGADRAGRLGRRGPARGLGPRASPTTCNQQGYWKADVKPPERREANGELTIVFTVHRGASTASRPAASRSAATSRCRSTETEAAPQAGAGRSVHWLTPGRDRRGDPADLSHARLRHRRDRLTATNEVGARPRQAGHRRSRRVRASSSAASSITGNTSIPSDRAAAGADCWRPAQPYYGPNVVRDRDALLGVLSRRRLLVGGCGGAAA